MLAVPQQNLHFLCRVPLGFINDLHLDQSTFQKVIAPQTLATPSWALPTHSCGCVVLCCVTIAVRIAHLDGVLHAGAVLDAALADGIGAHPDVLLHLIGLAELGCVSVQLLQGAHKSRLRQHF